jgi:hypothetical protein
MPRRAPASAACAASSANSAAQCPGPHFATLVSGVTSRWRAPSASAAVSRNRHGKPMWVPENGFAGLTSRWCSFGLRLADADEPTDVTPAGRTPRDLGLTVDGSVRTVTLGCAPGAAAWSYGGSDVLGRRSVSSTPLKIDKEAEKQLCPANPKTST